MHFFASDMRSMIYFILNELEVSIVSHGECICTGMSPEVCIGC